jgi:hypothetical protein
MVLRGKVNSITFGLINSSSTPYEKQSSYLQFNCLFFTFNIKFV